MTGNKLKTGAIGRACGKIILLGEHAVVHGCDAIAIGLSKGAIAKASPSQGPISLYIKTRNRSFEPEDGTREGKALAAIFDFLQAGKDGLCLEAEFNVPDRSGLGSSASLAAAIARSIVAIKKLNISKDRLFETVQASERVFHGNPSGLDAAVALEGGALIFSRVRGAKQIAVPPLSLLIFHSGERGNTGEMVARFAQSLSCDSDRGKRRLEKISGLVKQGQKALDQGDLEALGRAMSENHEMLKQCGVSTSALDQIVTSALNFGALGAKLTGGGGGGCAIVLTENGDQSVSKKMRGAGFKEVEV